MAKKRKSSTRARRRRPSLFTPPQAEVGRTVDVGIKSAAEGESVFTLTDGTKLHVKVAVPSITRSLDKFNANGDPVYLVQAGLMLKTVVPKRLRRKVTP